LNAEFTFLILTALGRSHSPGGNTSVVTSQSTFDEVRRFAVANPGAWGLSVGAVMRPPPTNPDKLTVIFIVKIISEIQFMTPVFCF